MTLQTILAYTLITVVALSFGATPAFAKSTPRLVVPARDAKPKGPAAKGKVSKPRARKVAVAQFDAPAESHVRNAVLAELANQDDVDVASFDDITFISRRYKLDMNTPEGRKKISDELGVQLWIDGRVSGETAYVTLRKANGKRVAHTEVKAPTMRLLDALTGERVWRAMGGYLSPREERRNKLLAQSELAHRKLEARQEEVGRQRTVAKEAKLHAARVAKQEAADRAKQLEDERNLATKKRVAVLAELSRQSRLVEERQEERLVAQRRQAEADARMQQLAAARSAPPQQNGYMASYGGYRTPPSRSSYGGYAAQSGGGYAAQSGVNRPATASVAAPAAPSAAAPAAPSAAAPAASSAAAPAAPRRGVSEATQRWLMQQPGYAPPRQAPAVVPAQRTDYAANSGNEGSAAPRPNGGVSPATQRWLDQQRQR